MQALPNTANRDGTKTTCLMVRREHVRLGAAGEGFLTGVVTESVYAGADIQVLVRCPSGKIVIVRGPASEALITAGPQRVSCGHTTKAQAIRAD